MNITGKTLNVDNVIIYRIIRYDLLVRLKMILTTTYNLVCFECIGVENYYHQ